MRKYVYMLFLILLFISYDAKAQETMEEDLRGWAKEWKYAFSKDGRQNWTPEFTLRYFSGLTTSGPMLTGGVRVDRKRTFGLMVGQGDTYLDYAPGDLYSIAGGVMFRRYFYVGKKKTFAFYSDLYAGAAWIYRIDGKYHFNSATGEQWEVIDDNVGDARFILGWQPGFRVRFYRNIHIFLGPTIATECLGLHLGIGF